MSTARWNDGLLDLFLGTGLLLIGVVWLMPPVSRLGGMAPLVILPLWPIARAAVLARGRGASEAAEIRWRGVLGRVLLLGAVAALLGLGMYRIATSGDGVPEDWVGSVIPAFLGVLIGIGAVSVGLLLGLVRLLVYGVVVALLSAAVTAANVHAGIYLTLSGAFIATVGVVILRRFLTDGDQARPSSG